MVNGYQSVTSQFCYQSVQRRPHQVQLGIHRRDSPLKGDATRTRHREQIAIPRRLRGVGGQGAVGAVVGDELFKVGEEGHSTYRVAGLILNLSTIIP